MPITDPEKLKRLSKLIALILRHRPDMIGLETLEPGGWVPVSVLLEGVNRQNQRISRTDLDQIVAENNKQRYSYDATATRIRANQGHSVEVDLQLEPAEPPPVLYHGTKVDTVPLVLSEGVKKMSRHAVHLSKDIATAIAVGSRRGKAEVLVVNAGYMHSDGHVFYVSDNGVWLTEFVPAKYIERVQ